MSRIGAKEQLLRVLSASRSLTQALLGLSIADGDFGTGLLKGERALLF